MKPATQEIIPRFKRATIYLPDGKTKLVTQGDPEVANINIELQDKSITIVSVNGDVVKYFGFPTIFEWESTGLISPHANQ